MYRGLQRLVILILMALLPALGCGRTALERPGAVDRGGDDGGSGVDDGGIGGAPDGGAVDVDAGGANGGDGGGIDCDAPRPEICGDGIDQDCDGVVDDGCSCDFDGSSQGVCRNGVVSEADGACLSPDFFEVSEGSCDGRDNDCDGQTDEGCACEPGETQPCYNGPEGSAGVGACAAGELLCTDNRFGGECAGEITPQPESCNGIDDSCDGIVDEGCACDFAELTDGVCATATLDAFGNCAAPEAYQAEELSCDGLDNDCDGAVDEGCGCDYGDTSTGVCGQGSVDTTSGECQPPASWQAEESACDGADNDCDGQTDEGCSCDPGASIPCYDGPEGTLDVGTCAAGAALCGDDGMSQSACEGQIVPAVETCDGADDDCDGVVDEGCPCDYGDVGVGVCTGGLRDGADVCQPPATYEADESTCDGLDNDCDGVADEGCGCNYQQIARGVCRLGTRDDAGACLPPASYEADETLCDGLNNDCDGATDEGCPCQFRGSSEGVCAQATRNNGGQCKPPAGFMGSEARCNDGADNDCDGLADCDDEDCAGKARCR